MDCDAFPELAKRFSVSSFPTIKVFPAEKTANPYTKEVAKVPMDYTGPRTGTRLHPPLDRTTRASLRGRSTG